MEYVEGKTLYDVMQPPPVGDGRTTFSEAEALDITIQIADALVHAHERGLIHRFEQWSALHEKQLRLWKAKAEAEAAAVTLSTEHNALDARIDAEKTSTPELARHAKHAVAAGHSTSSAAPSRTNRSREEAAALLARTKRIASDQKGLANFDKRIDAEKELANIYGQWIEVVAARQSAVTQPYTSPFCWRAS